VDRIVRDFFLLVPFRTSTIPKIDMTAVLRHRLGQTRPVTTVKLIIENSIEARLLEVQKKKTELANMTLGHNFSKQDLMQRRMEELRQLFSR
jgi:SNF2 family DNA or RNA helicase